MKKISLVIFLIIEIFFGANAFAKDHETLTLKQVNEAALKHYPKIFASYDKIKAAEGALLASKGAFDINLKQSYQDRSRGYYDGKIYDAEIEKQFGAFGSKVYGGYRKSYGSFPDYEGENLTNSSGEFRAGVKFSLLKNRDIDENRLGVILGNLGVEEGRIELANIKARIATDAAKAYWTWVSYGQILKVYEELYDLSEKRQTQFNTRAAKGDIANIVAIENQKNLLKRKSALQKAEQDFENSAIYLSLFFRDDNSNPLKPKKNQLPEIDFKPQKIANQTQVEKGIENAILKRPEIQIIKVELSKQNSELKYSKNLLSPELDVDFGVSKDQGDGDLATSQSNNYAKLNFSMPLQFSEARGKIAKDQSKINAIKYEQKLLEEQIKAEVMQIANKIENTSQIYSYLIEETSLAVVLQNAEIEKFKHGASNFFLVNLREQDLAYTKISAIESFKDLKSSLAEYNFATFEGF